MVAFIDELLESIGIKYEDLNAVEKQTYQEWLGSMQVKEISINDIRIYIKTMRLAIDEELSKFDNTPAKDSHLKARLKNYILLEAFLESPERARHQLQQQVKGMAENSVGTKV